MFEPVCDKLNAASVEICTRIFPLGFDVTDNAPNTFEELTVALANHGRMAIWTGDYHDTVFGDTEIWREFRAWHDWCHYRYNLQFNLPDEHAVCHVQAAQLVRLYGRGEDVAQMIATMFCVILDTLEQPLAGNNPESWWQFGRDNYGRWLPYARRLLERQGLSDLDAIRLSKEAYTWRAELGPAVPPEAAPAVVEAA